MFKPITAQKYFSDVCGLDEAGRGPWAGPVFTAAVILPQKHGITGLNDSKQLSPFERERLYTEIIEKALAYAIVAVSSGQIDRTDILSATKYGMQMAIKRLKQKPDFVLIDAVNINLPEIPQISLVKGDSRSEVVAAASILAKVSRDRYMEKMDRKYPQYGFAAHKGYGTAEHLEALRKYGPCPIHRRSFAPIKNILLSRQHA